MPANIERYQGLYKYKFRWHRWCVYCGCQAECIDHVFPLSLAKILNLREEHMRKHLRGGLYLVPSCNNCNIIAAAKPFNNIKDKRAYIQERLKKKYKNILRFKVWDDDELEGLGSEMRRQVIAGMRNRAVLEHRITFPDMKTVVPVKYI